MPLLACCLGLNFCILFLFSSSSSLSSWSPYYATTTTITSTFSSSDVLSRWNNSQTSEEQNVAKSQDLSTPHTKNRRHESENGTRKAIAQESYQNDQPKKSWLLHSQPPQLEQAQQTPPIDKGNRRPIPRPHLVLHVGPGKTGTTSIQCALHNSKFHFNNVSEDHNRGDPLSYSAFFTASCNDKNLFGSYSTQFAYLYRCLQQPEDKTTGASPKCLDWYIRQLITFRRPVIDNKSTDNSSTSNTTFLSPSPASLILSDEFLFDSPSWHWRAFLQRLSQHYHVVVVVYYRNFVDYSLSLYSQRLKHVRWPVYVQDDHNQTQNKTTSSSATTTTDLTMFLQDQANVLMSTLSSSTLTNYSLHSWLHLDTNRRTPTTNSTSGFSRPSTAFDTAHPTTDEKNDWITFRVLNFDDSDMDPVTRFFCHGLAPVLVTPSALPYATSNSRHRQLAKSYDDDDDDAPPPQLEACRLSLEATKPHSKLNAHSKSFLLVNVAVEVYRHGLVPPDQAHAAEAAATAANQTNTTTIGRVVSSYKPALSVGQVAELLYNRIFRKYISSTKVVSTNVQPLQQQPQQEEEASPLKERNSSFSAPSNNATMDPTLDTSNSITPEVLLAASSSWISINRELPWTCPSVAQWASILEATVAKALLAFEYKMQLPFYVRHPEKTNNIERNGFSEAKGATSRDRWVEHEVYHLYKAAQSGGLCYLDAPQILTNYTWRTTIRRAFVKALPSAPLAPKTPKPVAALRTNSSTTMMMRKSSIATHQEPTRKKNIGTLSEI
ncbi:hypothetical protein ACA910_007663 [Epithemia clementina (nom. ined.)]